MTVDSFEPHPPRQLSNPSTTLQHLDSHFHGSLSRPTLAVINHNTAAPLSTSSSHAVPALILSSAIVIRRGCLCFRIIWQRLHDKLTLVGRLAGVAYCIYADQIETVPQWVSDYKAMPPSWSTLTSPAVGPPLKALSALYNTLCSSWTMDASTRISSPLYSNVYSFQTVGFLYISRYSHTRYYRNTRSC